MITRVAEVVSGIGPKVKSLRKQHGYSLQSLAERADVSAATIHKIEQSDMVPTITTLLKIAAAFGLPVSYFVEDDDDHLPTIYTRPADRRPIYTSHAGLDLASITGPYGDFLMAAAVATVLPGASSGSKPMGHPGEELLYVMSGELAFTVADTAYMLSAGDALHFRTQQPHSWRNPKEEDCVVIWMALRPQQ